MLQRRGRPDLLHEPLGAEHGGELRLQHLDRDLAIVLQVLGEIDRRHAALAELALDAVAIGEGVLQRALMFGQRSPRGAGGAENVLPSARPLSREGVRLARDRRCRSTSYTAIPTHVDRLSDRTSGDAIGIATMRSA